MPKNAHGDWFYHTKIFAKAVILLYKNANQESQNGKAIQTTELITPPLLSFNMSMADVVDKWGKPRHSFNNNHTEHNLQVFFYRKDHVYEHVMFQLQFYNDKLFFSSIEVGKSMMKEETKMGMLANLLLPLNINNYLNVTDIPIYEDADGNFLLLQDEVNLSICHLSGSFAGETLSLIEEAKKYVPKSKH